MTPLDTATRERIVLCARTLIGVPYLFGGNIPSDGGLDCSGLTQWVLACAGVEPWATRYPTGRDDTADSLYHGCVSVNPSAVQPGDLVFYGRAGPPGEGKATHVVIVTDVVRDKSGALVHAEVTGQSRGDRTCVSIEVALRKGARSRTFATHRYRGDFVGFAEPRLRTA